MLSLPADSPALRPLNFPPGVPGIGWTVRPTRRTQVPVGVVNLIGRVFMAPADCPFRAADAILERIAGRTSVILVDMHAEATSEKMAMGRYLDGRVSAVLGTHTHVPTADERILPNGTAFQTDIGMTGAYDSIIGFRPDEALHRFLMNTPKKLEVAKRDIRLAGAMIDVDEVTGRASRIVRIQERLDE